MSSSSRRGSILNVPPPPGTRAQPNYARFIPREELGPVAAWNPSVFGGAPVDQRPAEPAEPSADEWRAEVSAARQAGYHDGYRDGLAALEGFKQSHAAQVSQQLAQFVEAFDAELDGLHARIAEGVARTAVQLARQVVRAELSTRPELVARVAAEAVEAVLLSARHITVHVHPKDLPFVASGADEALKARGARLLGSPGVERGGCRIESDVGAIDAQIATRWLQAVSVMGRDEAWSGGDPAVEPA